MLKINFIHIPKNGGTSIKEICNKSTIIYRGHYTNVYNNKINNQLVIIRNPIERFISSCYYALQKWSHDPNVKYLILKGIDTPEKWIQIWSNPKHKEYNNLMSEMLNNNHYIGNKLYKYKWIYTPQYLWINNPKFVIIMDNFDNEMQYLMNKYKLKGNIKKRNTTNNKNTKLSNKSIEFLINFYKNDFILYEKYKQINIDERI